MTLPPGFRVARGAEKAVVAALETPTETPRVLVIPQWCVNPLGPHGDGAEESSSLDLEDLERRAEEGTARLCMSHRTIPSSAYVGVEAVEGAVKEALGGRGGSVGLRGGHDPRKITHGTPLLRSDAMGPAIVVDMWSAPALFLRHIEVIFFNTDESVGWGEQMGRWYLRRVRRSRRNHQYHASALLGTEVNPAVCSFLQSCTVGGQYPRY